MKIILVNCLIFGSILWPLRTIIILLLAREQKQRTKNRLITSTLFLPESTDPSVSILIPAFNEAQTIARCMLSCIACSYHNKEILVIDDGSTDETSREAGIIQSSHPANRIKVFKLRHNKGKTAALNYALSQATSDLIVTLDADTIFSEKNSLHTFLRPLIHLKNCSGTTANLHVRHPHEPLGMVQRIEYTKVLNSSKRAQSLLRSILILPGAMSAFRHQALAAIGGFSASTLAEDADATMQLLRQGHLLTFQANCIGVTEGSHTLIDLLRQRLRWRVGQLQCLIKHSRLLLASPATTFFYIDMGVMNTISALTPVITVLALSQDISDAFLPLTTLMIGCFAADLAATAMTFQLDDQSMPGLWAYVLYVSFFTLFSPLITWAAISQLLFNRTTGWHTSKRY